MIAGEAPESHSNYLRQLYPQVYTQGAVASQGRREGTATARIPIRPDAHECLCPGGSRATGYAAARLTVLSHCGVDFAGGDPPATICAEVDACGRLAVLRLAEITGLLLIALVAYPGLWRAPVPRLHRQPSDCDAEENCCSNVHGAESRQGAPLVCRWSFHDVRRKRPVRNLAGGEDWRP